MAYVTDRAPFDLVSFAARVKLAVRPARKVARTHYDPRANELELNQRALDKVMMQAICARGFA